MGLIKKIFGGIFGLIGGIFGAIGKVFGFGKKDDASIQQDAAAPVTVTDAADESLQAAKGSFKEQIPAAPPAAEQQAAAVEAEMPKIPNFATDYFVNPEVNFSPRRRPGPSLSSFKEMAKQVGSRSASMG
ncbi:MAG: hypothetical protein ACFB0E_16475 [Leptolyngbyaceae cyanobacterium]